MFFGSRVQGPDAEAQSPHKHHATMPSKNRLSQPVQQNLPMTWSWKWTLIQMQNLVKHKIDFARSDVAVTETTEIA